MLKKIFCLTILLMLASSSLLTAADLKDKNLEERELAMKKALFIASTEQQRVLRIGLVDCIGFALKNNSEIKIKRIEPLLSEEDIRIAESDFEPTINLETSLEDSEGQSSLSTGPAVSTSKTTKLNMGVDGKLPAGTEYSLDIDNKKYKSNASTLRINPYYKSGATITITQPLFKGFGVLINRADIIIANNNFEKSNQDLKEELIDIISKVKESYYNYVLYIEKYKTAEISLKRARDLLNIVQKRKEKGLASNIDLLEAQTGVAEREDTLLAIEKALRFAEDNLKYVTNIIDDVELWNAEIEPLDKPGFEEDPIDLVESLKQAFEYRPDYETAKIELASQNIRIKVKKNSLLPTIDLTGSFALNGLNRNYNEALGDMSSTDYRDWNIGAKISFPWGNKEAKGNYEKAKLTKAQLLISFDRLQQMIILQVRDSVRGVNISEQKINTSKKRKETETARYEAIEKRFREGLVSTHDMLEYQEDLSQAEESYIQALIDYSNSLITLDKKIGITLVKNDIKLE